MVGLLSFSCALHSPRDAFLMCPAAGPIPCLDLTDDDVAQEPGTGTFVFGSQLLQDVFGDPGEKVSTYRERCA